MNELFSYLDYREFLRDHYDCNKSRHHYFSYRYVAGKTGLDASFYAKVLARQKHIAFSSIAILCEFLKFDKREAGYFSDLVHFNKAKSADEESRYLQKLLPLRRCDTTIPDKELNEYLSSWWNAATRELLKIVEFTGDYADLSSNLQPPVAPSQIQQSLNLLEKLGLVAPTADGVLRPTGVSIDHKKNGQSRAVQSYHKSILKLALSALDTTPKEHREIATLTVSASRTCFNAIRERIAAFNNEIIDLVKKDSGPEEVYQLNLNLFPLTRLDRKNGTS